MTQLSYEQLVARERKKWNANKCVICGGLKGHVTPVCTTYCDTQMVCNPCFIRMVSLAQHRHTSLMLDDRDTIRLSNIERKFHVKNSE